jgi:hypothetical protein
MTVEYMLTSVALAWASVLIHPAMSLAETTRIPATSGLPEILNSTDAIRCCSFEDLVVPAAPVEAPAPVERAETLGDLVDQAVAPDAAASAAVVTGSAILGDVWREARISGQADLRENAALSRVAPQQPAWWQVLSYIRNLAAGTVVHSNR